MYSLDEIKRLAFVEHGRRSLRLVEDGPLADLSFAAKDLIDIAGYKSAWGNPDRFRAADLGTAAAHAALVPLLAGAHRVGRAPAGGVGCAFVGRDRQSGRSSTPQAAARSPGRGSTG